MYRPDKLNILSTGKLISRVFPLLLILFFLDFEVKSLFQNISIFFQWWDDTNMIVVGASCSDEDHPNVMTLPGRWYIHFEIHFLFYWNSIYFTKSSTYPHFSICHAWKSNKVSLLIKHALLYQPNYGCTYLKK